MKKAKVFRFAVALLLALSICVPLIGCGEKSDGTQANTDTSPSTDPPSNSPTDSSPPPETDNESDTDIEDEPDGEEEFERTYTADDYDGWWYQSDEHDVTYAGEIIVIDAQAQTFSRSDKNGNLSRTAEFTYDSEKDIITVFDELYIEYPQLSFGEGYPDTLSISVDSEYIPVYERGEAIEQQFVENDSIAGTWYRDGVTDGDEVAYIEFTEDGSYSIYSTQDGELAEDSSGSFTLSIAASKDLLGVDVEYLLLTMGDNLTYISDDCMTIGIAYYLDDVFDARGEPAYGGMHMYIHESDIDTPEIVDAITSFKLTHLDWEDTSEGSLRFTSLGQVHYYSKNEQGYFPTAIGDWIVEDGVLTINWGWEYDESYTAQERDTPVVDECEISDVENGFVLSSYGQIILVDPYYM